MIAFRLLQGSFLHRRLNLLILLFSLLRLTPIAWLSHETVDIRLRSLRSLHAREHRARITLFTILQDRPSGLGVNNLWLLL